MTTQNQTKKGDFSQGSIPKTVLRMGIPIAMAEIVHVLYNVVDRIFIGHIPGVGTAALSGVGIAFPLISLVTAFANLCGTGGNPLCSMARGQGNNERAQRILETAFTMLLGFSAVLTVVLFLFARPFLAAMGGDAETLPYAVNYFRIYVAGTVFVLISLGMNPFINGMGFPKIGMGTVLIGAVLNIALDALLLFVFHMGVEGAAIATVISQFASVVLVVRKMLVTEDVYKLVPADLKIRKDLLKEILSMGLPAAVQVTAAAPRAGVVAVERAVLDTHGRHVPEVLREADTDI